MAKIKVVLSEKPVKYSDCPFCHPCGWACRIEENDACKALGNPNSDNPKFDFSKCPYCISITDIINK